MRKEIPGLTAPSALPAVRVHWKIDSQVRAGRISGQLWLDLRWIQTGVRCRSLFLGLRVDLWGFDCGNKRGAGDTSPSQVIQNALIDRALFIILSCGDITIGQL